MSNKTKKGLLTLIALVIIGISFYYLFNSTRTNTSGEIIIIVVDETGTELINEKQSFEIGETMMDILERSYDIEVDNGFLIKIETVEARNRNVAYIQILINDVYATKGIKQMRFSDGDIITFKYTKIGDE